MSIIDNSIQLFTSNINSNIIYDVSTSNTFTLLSLFNSSNTYYINQINSKQNLLNASTVLLGIGSNITELDYSKITINKPTNFQADWNTTIINKPDVYTKSEVNNINILANYYNITYINNNFYTKSSIDTSLSGKEAVLTFNSPLTRTTNTIGINLNSYASFSALNSCNYITNSILNSYATYTALAASNYITNSTTGLINYYNTTQINNISNFNSNFTTQQSNILNTKIDTKENTLTFNAPLTRTTNTIGINLNNYVNFTALAASNYVNTTTLNNYATYTALAASNYITNSTTGLINYYNTTQINNISNFNSNFTTQQSNILNTKIDTKENLLTFNAPLTRTTNTIGINLNSYATYTALAASNYITNSTTSLVNYPSFTILNTCNYITNSTLNSYATYTALAASNYITNSTTGLINYPSFTVLNSCNYLTAGNFVAKSGDTMTGALNTTGLNINSITINNWLFNNNGGNHGDINDFNAVTTAGYKFIQGNTNSPSTILYTQYYSWLIGIGNNFPVTGAGSYSCQFAVPRLPTNNPRLFLRFNEAGSWGGWGGVIAASADALTAGNKTISGNLTVNGDLLLKNNTWHKSIDNVYRFYFGDEATFFCSGGGVDTNGFIVLGSAATGYAYNLAITNSGNANIRNNLSMGGTLSFGNRVQDYLIYLWGTTYGFGINASTLRYNSENSHKFYAGSTNTATIDASGNLTITGGITTGANVNSYLGGLRINGFDTGNTLYSGTRNIGITFDNGYKFTVNCWGGNSEILSIDNSGVTIRGIGGVCYAITTTNSWFQYTGTTPTSVANSLIFQHRDTTSSPQKNSRWWFDGSESSTNAAISDKRSKYNIQDFNSLEIINKLEPKVFDVIDDKDVNHQFGFIAQDIEQIPELSKLVYTTTDYIANIYSYGNHTNINSNCIITANDDLSGKINVGDELKFVSNNDVDKEFIIDATPYINRCKRRYAKVTEIISSNQFKVDCEINNFCSIEDPFLIYGKKVDDAKSLDYNSFIALNTKAIQELYKIIQQQQEQINNLGQNIQDLLKNNQN